MLYALISSTLVASTLWYPIPQKKIVIRDAKPIELYDVQYGKTFRYKAVRIEKLLGQKTNSLAIHFANKMIVPYDSQGYIATHIWNGKKWSQKFPQISRPDPVYKDPYPITFKDLKFVSTKKISGVNFFKYVGSPTGIVKNYKSLTHKYFPNDKGALVFKNRCEYCHGIDNEGAKFGIDFLDPVPIYKKRGDKLLFYHVRYPKGERFQFGLKMPHQKDFKQHEAKSLREWLIKTHKKIKRIHGE